MCNQKIVNYDIIEVPISATATVINFPDQPQLRDRLISGLEVLTPQVAAVSPDSFQTPATIAQMKKTFVELWVGNAKKARRMPVLSLNRTNDNTAGNSFVFQLFGLEPVVLSWTKCQLVLSEPTGNACVLSFGVYYYNEQ